MRLADQYILAAMRFSIIDFDDSTVLTKERAVELVDFANEAAKHACRLWGHILPAKATMCDRCGVTLINATIYKMGDAK